MNLALRTFIAIPLAGLLLAPAPAAAGRILGTWPASGIAGNPAEEVRLTGRDGQVLATVNRARVARLVDVVSRIEAAAGISARLFVVQTQDRQPNALAATGRDGRNMVGITPAMLELLGDDDDAYAALIGHEVAHLTQRHGAERASRQGLMQGLGLVATLLAGARGNANASRVIDFGGILVDRSYSREEERDADRLGIGFASAAGYDPQGAVRLFERMASAGRTAPLAFLSTHPGGGERLASARATIASLPSGQRASDARDVTQEDAPSTSTALWSERDYAATGSTASQQEREHAAAIAMALQQERHDAEIGARLAADALRALQSDASAGHPVAWPAPQPNDGD
jgi:predicted Zn-dependent protease